MPTCLKRPRREFRCLTSIVVHSAPRHTCNSRSITTRAEHPPLAPNSLQDTTAYSHRAGGDTSESGVASDVVTSIVTSLPAAIMLGVSVWECAPWSDGCSRSRTVDAHRTHTTPVPTTWRKQRGHFIIRGATRQRCTGSASEGASRCVASVSIEGYGCMFSSGQPGGTCLLLVAGGRLELPTNGL